MCIVHMQVWSVVWERLCAGRGVYSAYAGVECRYKWSTGNVQIPGVCSAGVYILYVQVESSVHI